MTCSWLGPFLEDRGCVSSSYLGLPSSDLGRLQFVRTPGDLRRFRLRGRRALQGGAVAQREELWSSSPTVLLPGVDQLLPEPAGQRLTDPVEQLGQLNVVIPVVLPEELLGLKETTR